MALDRATLAAASAGDKAALARVLAAHYPQVWRMASNLTGRQPLGRDVSTGIMRRSLLAAQAWEHEDAPVRWFRHHTVLAARDAAPGEPPPDDVLLAHGPADDLAYAAFVRALRGLAPQQREAFLLHHGEGFDLRQLGIAMDCSVDAAAVHLRQATLALQALAGHDFGRFVESARAAYAASAPDESLALPYARRLLRPGFWTALVHVIGWLLLLTVVAALAGGLWWVRPRLVF